MHSVLASLGKTDDQLVLGTLLDRLGVVGILLLFFSPLFWSISHVLLTRSARNENRHKPGMLFFSACALQVGLLGLLIPVLYYSPPGSAVLILHLATVFMLVLCIAPTMGDDHFTFRKSNPLPRMRFHLGDLSIAMLYYGLLIALYQLVQDAALRSSADVESCYEGEIPPTIWQLWSYPRLPWLVPSRMVTLEIAMFVVVSIGMIAALDVLRRIQQPLSGTGRSLAVIGILVYFTATFVTGGLVAWIAWRTSLRSVELTEWRRKREHEKLAVPPIH